jgi:mannose-6-phosphate isomerase-like protein (cupin superfamily)
MDEFGSYHTMLIVRVHTGPAERHQLWADQMIINKGTVTLVYGGTMQDEHPNGTRPGETLGSGITGGKELVLHAGEIVQIPANVPHWVKLAPGATTTYLIFKEK